LIERIIGYPIVKEKDVTVVETYHWIEAEKGPYYRVDRSIIANGLELTSEGGLSPDHRIPMEAILYAEEGHTPYIYPCNVCLERSREHKEKHGYSLSYGCLIIFKTDKWKRQYCTHPECTNNIIEWYEEVIDDVEV